MYEGVFSTFSQDLDIVLEMVNLIEKNTNFGDICMGNSTSNNSILASFKVEDCVAEKMIFKLSDVVALCANSIDLDYATKDSFTDGAISKNYSGILLAERELEPWDGANEELQTTNSANSLDAEEESKGWDANEMFRTNAEKYNVKSTYDSSLQGYTIPLEPKNTDEYKKQEAKASKIAQEIENNPSYKQRINLENGDEEDRYSAVLRPVDNVSVSNSAARFVPHKKNIPGKMVPSRAPFAHQNKPPNPQLGNMNSSITPTHSFNKNNCVPQPPNSLPIMPSGAQLHMVNNKPPPHIGGLQMTSPPLQHQLPPPNQGPPPRLMGSMQPPRTPLNHGVPPHHLVSSDSLNKDSVSDKHDGPQMQGMQDNKSNSTDYRAFQDENLAPALNQTSPKNIVDNRREDTNKLANSRDERGRDQQIAEFKKFSSDFKLTEDHRPVREEGGGREDCTPPPVPTLQKDKTPGSEDGTDNDCTTPDSDGSKIKKSILNPNAKAFTPRAVPAATPPSAVSVAATAVIPPRLHTQSPVVAVPQHQLVPNLGQPIFTPMGPQYLVSGTPVSMSLTSSFPPATMSSAHRFRKPGPMGPTQQDFAPSVHVAAATGQPILTPGLPSPAQLAVQYNPAQGMMAPSPHQTAMGYPQMMYRYPLVGPRVVSPQQVGTYGEVFMAPHPGLQGPHTVSVSAVQSMVPQGNQGPHSNAQNPQSQGQCTPMHTAPSPVHQQGNQTPSQTPTPSGHVAPSTTPQSVVYHHHQMAQSMQGGLHTPPSTQAMQAIHASHINQSHPHAHQHSFGPTQQIVLMHQPAHGPHAGGPHSLQGHAIHGQPSNHLGNPGGHVLQHPGQISVIPTSSAMVHAPMGGPFGPHPHQGRDRGRQHAANR